MPKKRIIKPTAKQKRAFIYLSENVGTKQEALLKAGYSPAMAEEPHRIENSKGFQVLLNQYLPEDLVAKAHRQLIMAGNIDKLGFPKELSNEEIEGMIAQIPGANLLYIRQSATDKKSRIAYFIFPDHARRKDGIDMAYKLRNAYPPSESNNKNFNINTSMEDLMKLNLQKRQANETNF